LSYNEEYPYSDKTKEMFELMPSWMKMAKDKDSVGQQFMNFFGLKLEEIEDVLDELLENRILITNNTDQPDIIYKFDLPSVYVNSTDVTIIGAGRELEEKQKLKEFYNTNDTFIIDGEKNIAYLRDSYGGGDGAEGVVSVTIEYNGEEIWDKRVGLRTHHVWNSLDEFGMLLSLPRNYNENNIRYKNRLLNVFKYLPNSTHKGLTYGISNELGLIKTVDWENDSEDLVIEGEQILKSSIKIDGKRVEDDQLIKLSDSKYSIKALNEDKSHKVKFIHGVELHALNDEDDIKFQNKLYKTNKTATEKLKYYVDRITNDIPLMWGSFLWDKGWWDPANKDLLGISFLPSIWDPNVEDWIYLEEEKRQPLDVEGMEHFMFSSYYDESQQNGKLGFNKGKLYGIPVGDFSFSKQGDKVTEDVSTSFDKGELVDLEVGEFKFSSKLGEVEYSMKEGFDYGLFTEEG